MEQVKAGQKYEEFYKKRMEEEREYFRDFNTEMTEFIETDEVRRNAEYFARKDYFTYIKTQEFIEKNGREPNEEEDYLIYESYDEIEPTILELIEENQMDGEKLTSAEVETIINSNASRVKITQADIIEAAQGNKEAIEKIEQLTASEFEKYLYEVAKILRNNNGGLGDNGEQGGHGEY